LFPSKKIKITVARGLDGKNRFFFNHKTGNLPVKICFGKKRSTKAVNAVKML
jgi:hypothetical protein